VGEVGRGVSDRLPPRIPRGEAVGRVAILTRLYDIEQELERVAADIKANQREYDELIERNHFLVSEHDRTRRKLMYLDDTGEAA
jgi:regulator of replication initiation timing